MQFTTLALSALLGLASAQTQVTVVEVSSKNNSLTFSPDNIKVSANSMVQFQFLAGNHTVTQSTFDEPCQPISLFSNVTGFHSGFVPVAASANTGSVPTYTIMINNTNPIWVYCAQAKHCENGMSMVINENTAANSSRSLTNYKAAAVKATTVVPSGTESGTSGSTTTSSGNAPANTTNGSKMLTASTFGVGLAALAGSFFLL
ncbi:Cupredoxin [Niveomyces insectorum RCEF 264]|uniref:Cupredoxin n=1 Tax=Niveomyces insectorum RCEF 264 TaxID=1081102 RepID=A0A167QES2_9HYPO|nr:Cupredoxin [Niveomyces insectorum RCEF 264]